MFRNDAFLAKFTPHPDKLNLAQKIREERPAGGILPFPRFMELSLYCPVYGYYEKEKDTIGRRGDYYTNVSIGSLFGELLAFQFATWLTPMQATADRLKIVEGGA